MQAHKSQLAHPEYRPDIDGLRAIAVLAVVIFHATPRWLPGGFVGVDIFFVISGYLISTILFENLDKGTFSFLVFYGRRVKRIFPALILVLAASLVFGWFALLADEFKQLGKHVAAGAGFVSNLVLWDESGYFDTSADTKPLLHLWSLGIEEQFYIVCPFLFWLVHRFKFGLLAVSLLVASISFGVNIHLSGVDIVGDFYAPQSRFWELMSGSVVAWLTLYRPRLLCREGSVVASVVSVIGLAVLVVSLIGLNKGIRFPGWFAILPVMGSVLVIMAGSTGLVNRWVLSNRIAVWFGLISFPLYLWHWPLLSFANIILSNTPDRSTRLFAVVVSIVLAALTYYCLEKPIRFGASGRPRAFVITVVMAVLGCLGFAVYKLDGMPNRQSLAVVKNTIIQFAGDDPVKHEACLEKYGLQHRAIRYCGLSGNAKPHIALIGDSHAAAIFTGLAKQLADVNHESLLLLGGRLFIDVATFPNGSDDENAVYRGGIVATNFVAQEKSIDTVIMVSMGAGYLDRVDNFYLLSDPSIKDRRKVFEIGMRKTLDLMVKNNKQIIFVLDNPTLPFTPKICMQRPLPLVYNDTCSMPRSVFDQEQQVYRELVFAVLADYPMVRLFDQAAYFCDAVSCVFKRGSKILYSDHDHLSGDGSELIGRELIRLFNGGQTKLLE
jgi:peptidoglycan/LPS O-acetylase OafA/YrhL